MIQPSEPQPVDVTVTIASWNRADLLERCLRTILDSDDSLKIEIVVIDNASSDNSVVMVRERFPSVLVIANRENRGFGRAHNQAIEEARGRYILVLNNDAALLPETISTLVTFMEDHPRIGICTCPAQSSTEPGFMTGGGMRRFPTVTREAAAGLLQLMIPPFGWPGSATMLNLSSRILGACPKGSEQEVAWAKGGLLMMRSRMLREIGTFDERFFMFYEETDLCLRARQAGWSVWQVPGTCYVHDAGQSSRLRGDRHRIWSESGVAYYYKHHGYLRAALWRAQDAIILRTLVSMRHYIGRLFGSRPPAARFGGKGPSAGAEL